MCSNEELKTILNDEVIPRLDGIDTDVKNNSQRIVRLEKLQVEGDTRMTQHEHEIAMINDKLDRLPERTATEAREQIFHLIDERNLFYIKSSGRRVLIALGAVMTAVAGAMAMRLFEVMFS